MKNLIEKLRNLKWIKILKTVEITIGTLMSIVVIVTLGLVVMAALQSLLPGWLYWTFWGVCVVYWPIKWLRKYLEKRRRIANLLIKNK